MKLLDVLPISPRWRRIALVLLLLAGLGFLLICAAAVGYWAGKNNTLEKVNEKIFQPALARFEAPAAEDVVTWETIQTHFFPLQIARISLSPNGSPAIWALEEVDGDILYVTRLGEFGYLDRQNSLHRIQGLHVPMGLEELTQSELFQDPIFQLSEFRTFDLLSIPAGGNLYDLYVSHHRYRNGCFEVVVSHTQLAKDDAGVHAVSGAWDEIFFTDPCIPVKSTGMRLAGHEGGGRLARLNGDTSLFSLGAHQFDGVDGPYQVGQDNKNDLSKIIEISLKDGSHSFYARGFRNPQGLLVASDGRVWETEHGPRGGDEVNLIQQGKNYGWPIATYGTNYGAVPWPFNPHPGKQVGFERPRFAFVPSIGISNLIEPSAEEFPEWDEHLLVASLAGNTLYALKTEGDDITYAEPISIGERMRDIISLSDGRVAIITDSGWLIFIRNGDKHRDKAASFEVANLTERPKLQAAESIPTTAEVTGSRVFFYYCGTCHTTDGKTLVGPPLNGVLGRRVGSVADYPYSAALADVKGRWTPSRLRKLLNHDGAGFDESAMPAVSLYKDQFQALVAYLHTTEAKSAEDRLE